MKRRRYPDRNAGERRRRFYMRAMWRLRALFGGRCQECGSLFSLEFAHVAKTALKGRGRGQSRRFHDIKRNPEAYRLLCRSCHCELDFAGRDPWRPATAAELEEVPF